MGTGIYKLQSIDMNSQIQLKLNSNWWNLSEKTPKIDEVNIKIYTSASEVYNAYKLGSIDILNTSRNSNIEENIGTIGYNLKKLMEENLIIWHLIAKEMQCQIKK